MPIKGHTYVMTVDVARGRGQDYSTFSIFDVSEKPFKQVGIYRDNLISPLLFPDVIARYAKMYNEAIVIVENNDQGQIVCNNLHYDIEYPNVFMESTVKSTGIVLSFSAGVYIYISARECMPKIERFVSSTRQSRLRQSVPHLVSILCFMLGTSHEFLR